MNAPMTWGDYLFWSFTVPIALSALSLVWFVARACLQKGDWEQ